jgi:hypothetical protein
MTFEPAFKITASVKGVAPTEEILVTAIPGMIAEADSAEPALKA